MRALVYGTTFFPGVSSADAAAPVAISPGEDRRIEIRLKGERALLHRVQRFRIT